MAARFFGLQQPQTVVAVTGTSGKTSVAEFTRQIFAASVATAASLGTIGVVHPSDSAVYGSLTTPDPVTLHKTLAELAVEGITHLAFEASSHGLDQHRLDGVRLKAAGLHNLGRDHLDYHPTVEAYLAAKLRLFANCCRRTGRPSSTPTARAATRADRVAEDAGRRVFTVGRTGETLKLVSAWSATGLRSALSVAHEGASTTFACRWSAAIRSRTHSSPPVLPSPPATWPSACLPALQSLKGVKGRLEIIGEERGGLAVVDYAHKPEALAAALDACARSPPAGSSACSGAAATATAASGRSWAASRSSKADVVIVTDDNPRTEAAAAIRAEILSRRPGAQEIGDRAEAIAARLSP